MSSIERFHRRAHRGLIHPFWSWKDGHYPYAYLREFERTQYWSSSDLRRLQWERLRSLLAHAYARCPYYRRVWDEAGTPPDAIRCLEDFTRLPLLEKADIQARGPELRRDDVPVSQLVQNRTGGSTGEPLVFYLDRERRRSRSASTIRHDRWAGKDVDTHTASIWGHQAELPALGSWWSGLRERWIYRVMYLDASTISRARIDAFLDRVRRERPEVVVGYANAIHLVARYLRETGRMDFPRPRSVITSAEFLEPDRRGLIEEVFEAPVFDRYGCREVSVIASECGAHDGLHLNAEGLYVEILREGEPAPPGQPGEIVVTDLLNLGMPLIRYRIRDAGVALTGACTCGRGLPRIRMVGGRVTDFITTPEGTLVSGASLTIFLVANIPGIGRAQLLQESRESVRVRVVPGSGFLARTVEEIEAATRARLGPEIRIEVETVDEIPVSPSGKHRFCISEVDPFA